MNSKNSGHDSAFVFMSDYYDLYSKGYSFDEIVHGMGFESNDDFDTVVDYLGMEIENGALVVKHYGMPRRSGRYPYGSGDNPYQHEEAFQFINTMREYHSKGLNDTETARAMGYSTTEYRQLKTLYNAQVRDSNIKSVRSMTEDGHDIKDIADRLNISVSTARGYLNADDTKMKNTKRQIDGTKQMLMDQVERTGILDIGEGTHIQLGISESRLKAAVKELQQEGYYVHNVNIYRIGSDNQYTTVQTLSKYETKQDAFDHAEDIRTPRSWSENGGADYITPKEPASIDMKRVYIRYSEDGGQLKDGTIELRRNVDDLDLKDKHYAQTRIRVGENFYMKGMAYVSDDIPKGYDVVYNTNKHRGAPPEKVFKSMKTITDENGNQVLDLESPFGATIKRQQGALNIVNEEGDWIQWQHNMSAQFLSKQPEALIKDRLDDTYKTFKEEYETIMKVENPTIREYLLNEFSDTSPTHGGKLQSAQRHLSAKGFERGNAEVILPLVDIRPNQIYAPNYQNGEKVVLIRYPHGGTFELPELTVNNRIPSGKSMIGNAIDAVGIHPSVAAKLSGADFDGDTVYVFPKTNKNGQSIVTSPSLEGLKDFEPKVYQVDHKTISPQLKQTQMGIVSNLITDMTIKGASEDELARAVRHSMVVIDSEKHNLDYKQSAIDNGIAALHKKYQGRATGGASTLISVAKKNVDDIDENSGKSKKVYLMDKYDDARKLSSGTAKENLYADYVNRLKGMANDVEKDKKMCVGNKRDPKATEKYAKEVKELTRALNNALANVPQERNAQVQAYFTYNRKKTPEMNKDDLKKLRVRSTEAARNKVGAKGKDVRIHITDKQWEAIENNAFSPTKLKSILRHADASEIRQHVTPRDRQVLSPAKIARAKALKAAGHTMSEIADSLGMSEATIRYNLEL